MKDRIIKMLKSKQKEDILVALRLIVNFYDPIEFIRSLEDIELLNEIYGSRDIERPIFIWNADAVNLFMDKLNSFYYKYAENRYILYTPDAISICFAPYSSYLPIIKH